MTDYFALLNQPRRPWLAPEQLKQAYHAAALRVHPDAQAQRGSDASSDELFAQLNEAYQVLQDPKRRLHHLLSLAGHAPDRVPGTTPAEIEELFPLVAAATQRASAIVQKSAAASNALSRSLLKPERQRAAEEVNAVHVQVAALQQTAETRLQDVDRNWSGGSAVELGELQQIHLQLSYVTRWIGELEARRSELSSC